MLPFLSMIYKNGALVKFRLAENYCEHYVHGVQTMLEPEGNPADDSEDLHTPFRNQNGKIGIIMKNYGFNGWQKRHHLLDLPDSAVFYCWLEFSTMRRYLIVGSEIEEIVKS